MVALIFLERTVPCCLGVVAGLAVPVLEKHVSGLEAISNPLFRMPLHSVLQTDRVHGGNKTGGPDIRNGGRFFRRGSTSVSSKRTENRSRTTYVSSY